MGNGSNIFKAFGILRRHGFSALLGKIAWRLAERKAFRRYQEWIAGDAITAAARGEMRDAVERFARRPLISVILPVYNIDEKWLRRCIDSVRNQIYGNWELCIADDASPNPEIRELLTEYAEADDRIKVVFRPQNGHISAASNSALELASGEFAVLLDHDDELSEDALFHVAKEIVDFPQAAFIYSDEDLIDEAGVRSEPKFKPDFSRDLLYSLNLITHLSAYRVELLRSIGGFRLGSEGSQDYDLALRVLEVIDESQIRHIPRILYHWRAIRGSVAFGPGEKPYAYERAREAIREHLERIGKIATVVEGPWNLNRVVYELPVTQPSVKLVVCGSGSAEFAETGACDSVSVDPISAAALNEAVSGCTADLICFINPELAPLDSEWLSELMRLATQPEIGAVGGKVSDGGGMVVAGGLVFGGPELVRVAHALTPREAAGNICRNIVISNFSAVSLDCMMIRRELFEELGGFNSERYPVALFGADLCLRIRERGLRIVQTPFAEFRGAAISWPAADAESDAFRAHWGNVIACDPFYNPNLAKTGRPFSIAVE